MKLPADISAIWPGRCRSVGRVALAGRKPSVAAGTLCFRYTLRVGTTYRLV